MPKKKKLTHSLALSSWWFGVFVIVACLFCSFVCLTFSHHLMIFLFSCVRTTFLYSLHPLSEYLICIFFYYASHLSFLFCFISFCVGWLLAHLLDFWDRKSCSSKQPRTPWMTVNWSSGLHHPRAGTTSVHHHARMLPFCGSHTLFPLSSSWLAAESVGPGFCCCCSFLNFPFLYLFISDPKQMFLLLRNIICCFLLASSSAIMCMIHHSWRRWCSHGMSALHHNIPDKVSLRVEWFISAYNFRDFNSWWFNFNISGTTVRGGITMTKLLTSWYTKKHTEKGRGILKYPSGAWPHPPDLLLPPQGATTSP